jgi:hypothetical protein
MLDILASICVSFDAGSNNITERGKPGNVDNNKSVIGSEFRQRKEKRMIGIPFGTVLIRSRT